MNRIIQAGLAAAFVLFAPAAFGAEDSQTSRDLLLPNWGMSVSLGGGVTDFSDARIGRSTDPGGAWDARLAIGTRRTIAYEVAYTGGAQSIDALGMDKNALLFGNGVEGNVKAHLFKYQFRDKFAMQPFLTAGAGYKHYYVQADTNTSAIKDSEDFLEVPVGAGISFHYGSVLADLRGVFRPAFGGNMVEDTTNTAMDNWAGTLNVGFEF